MPVLRILHRGGNLRQSLSLASHPAVDAIEADLWVRGDRLVAHHERPLGPLPFVLGSRGVRREDRNPVRLPEIVQAAGTTDSQTWVVLDLRSWLADPAPDLTRELLQLPSYEHVLVSCEVWAIADRLQAWVPDLRVAYSVRSEPQYRRFVEQGIEKGQQPVAVAIRESLLRSSEEVRALRRLASAVSVWTVDDVDRALELADWGVDAIASNHLAVLNAL